MKPQSLIDNLKNDIARNGSTIAAYLCELQPTVSGLRALNAQFVAGKYILPDGSAVQIEYDGRIVATLGGAE